MRRDWCGLGFGIAVVEKNVTGASGVLEVLVLVLVGFAQVFAGVLVYEALVGRIVFSVWSDRLAFEGKEYLRENLNLCGRFVSYLWDHVWRLLGCKIQINRMAAEM